MTETLTVPASTQHIPTHHESPKRKKFAFVNLIVLVLIFALAAVSYLYYTTQQRLKHLSTLQGQQEVAKKEVDQITTGLAKLTLLPKEDPVVATIVDSKFLATQSAFYQNAENGDKLVVYPKAQKAYIFSPAKNIIVNAGPLVLNQDQAAAPVRFEVRNGSSVVGAASKLKDQLEKNQLLVSALSDASRKDYVQTLIIPINQSFKADQLSQFAQAYHGASARNLRRRTHHV